LDRSFFGAGSASAIPGSAKEMRAESKKGRSHYASETPHTIRYGMLAQDGCWHQHCLLAVTCLNAKPAVMSAEEHFHDVINQFRFFLGTDLFF